MREIVSPLDGFASPFGPQRGFNPLRIFSNDEPGAWFEANDATTLFTDVAGTTPVTTPGDAVALQLDKSQGLTLGPELVTNGDFATGDFTGFSSSTGWAIVDGGANLNSNSGSDILTPLITPPADSFSVLTFDVTQYSAAALTVRGNGPAFPVLAVISALGSYSVTLGPGVTPSFIRQSATTNTTIDNISVRELPGNHRTQATVAARPLYALHPVGGVRNLLEYTEEFDNAVWTKVNSTVDASGVAPPFTGDAFDLEVSTPIAYLRFTTSKSAGTEYAQSVYAKAGTANWVYLRDLSITGGPIAWFDLGTGSVGTVESGIAASISDEGSGWYRISIVSTSDSPIANDLIDFGITNGDNTRSGTVGETVSFFASQLEEGSTATNYQRVGSFLDVSEEGKARRGRLWYNGTSHFMQTGTITPGTDKMQVFAGVRKLSDDPQSMLMEFSESIATNNGSFHITQFSGTQFFRSKGTSQVSAQPTGFNPPVSLVMTALGDISGDSAILRIDGVQEAISTADQGTGNYLAYPLYFGARGGTSLFFNGYEDTSIIRFGPNLDDTTISKVESYVASKTPEETI